MHMRHAAVVAGLTLGFMSGAAMALPITYTVDFNFTGTDVSGSIVTDGKAGNLSKSDISSFQFTVGTGSYSNLNAPLLFGGNVDLRAVGYQLLLYNNHDNSVLQFGGFSNGSYFDFVSYDSFSQETNSNGDVRDADVSVNPFILGTSSTSVGTVPLPTSAPMFGAALIALGAVGYGMKRKASATA